MIRLIIRVIFTHIAYEFNENFLSHEMHYFNIIHKVKLEFQQKERK